MADLKSVTVEYLRELARKHLGRGHSKLKKKDDLLSALVKLVPGLAKLSTEKEPQAAAQDSEPSKAKGARKAPVAVSAASRTEKPEDRPQQPAAPARPLPGDDDEKTPVQIPPRPAEVVTFPPKPRPSRLSVDEEPTLTRPAAPAEEPPAPEAPAHVAQHAAEPLVEGFFVARVAGEQEAFRHHLTESQHRQPREALGAPDYAEHLGELPMDYADDTALLLARDPHTLFVLWDFSEAARARALAGLESPRAVLRVYDDGDTLLRVIDVALESRSYYIHGLPPGHPYRVEVHFVGGNNRSRRIGHSSNRVFLPPVGPSSDTSVRFLRMPPVTRSTKMEAQAATAPTRTADIEEREYITWRRVPLPGSGGFEDIPERRRERIVGAAPSEGSSEKPYWDVPRPLGSSEQWAGLGRPGGSSEQWAALGRPGGASEQWAGLGRPGGSSEQWAGLGSRPGGSSEQWAGLGNRPGGSSEQWAGSHPSAGPGGGSSEQSAGASGAGRGGATEQWEWVWTRPGGASETRAWTMPTSSGQGR
ncbi:DUF4912 domain-containing protein [Archangium sp.]|jgi:hypothetical protein|uniref:DUF4912 domain-containing protein n=1 Tax=Archangium sp. TaxID=1872627 RepID=UPI002EDB9148